MAKLTISDVVTALAEKAGSNIKTVRTGTEIAFRAGERNLLKVSTKGVNDLGGAFIPVSRVRSAAAAAAYTAN
jgi:hypothetical protein